MKFLQSFKLAFSSILASKARSLLTMLGIIIGVSAVIVIIGLGNGLEIYMRESFESMGSNLITAMVRGRGSSRNISADDMYELVEDNSEVLAAVTPDVSVSGTVKIGTETSESTSITGVGEDFCRVRNYDMYSGRFIQYIDILRRHKVCVVGPYIANTYFNGNPVGKTLKISGETYTIVGMFDEKADGGENGDDNAIFIPYTNAAKMTFSGRISNYYFSSVSEDTVEAAKAVIEQRLYKAFGNENAYVVISMSEILDMMSTMLNVLVFILAAIAAISLVVGGVGIMNIMLVSVSERTREIGIRKALGAKQRNIMSQFVIEAATTAGIGGVIGIGFGYVLSGIATALILRILEENLAVTPTFGSIMMAFCISVAIGIFFGYLPAKKAARLNPIDALRYE
ncbi:MAG: ABC transporter permease [Oscillospiraceae bacterium]|nr:ABC transporter permease [Oscillospiraceae bacterium]